MREKKKWVLVVAVGGRRREEKCLWEGWGGRVTILPRSEFGGDRGWLTMVEGGRRVGRGTGRDVKERT